VVGGRGHQECQEWTARWTDWVGTEQLSAAVLEERVNNGRYDGIEGKRAGTSGGSTCMHAL